MGDRTRSVETRIADLEIRVQQLDEKKEASRKTKNEPKFFSKLKKKYKDNIERMRCVEEELKQRHTAANHAKNLLMILFSLNELTTTSRLKLDFWRVQFIEVAVMRKFSVDEDARDDLWKQCKVEISKIVTAVYRHQTKQINKVKKEKTATVCSGKQIIETNELDVENFCALAIMGNFHQSSAKYFKHAAAGSQCTSISLMAIVASHVKSVDNWDSDFIDEVLREGDKLHIRVLDNKNRSSVRDETRIDIDEIPEKIFCRIGGCQIEASVGALEDGTFASSTEIDSTVRTAMERNQNQSFILRMFGSCTAIIKRKNQYCIFDPHSRNRSGFSAPNGVAGLFHFDTLLNLIKYLKRTVGEKAEQIDLYPVSVKLLNSVGSKPEHGKARELPKQDNSQDLLTNTNANEKKSREQKQEDGTHITDDEENHDSSSDESEDDENSSEVKTIINRENASSFGGAGVDATEMKLEGDKKTSGGAGVDASESKLEGDKNTFGGAGVDATEMKLEGDKKTSGKNSFVIGGAGVDANEVKLQELVTKLEKICVTLEDKRNIKLNEKERKEYNENKTRKGKMDALLKEENEPKHLVQQLAEIFLPILNGNPKILDFWKLQYIKVAMLKKFEDMTEDQWKECKFNLCSLVAIEDDTATEQRPTDEQE